jgi:hypothetical protein
MEIQIRLEWFSVEIFNEKELKIKYFCIKRLLLEMNQWYFAQNVQF